MIRHRSKISLASQNSVIYFSFAASQFTVRVGEWDLSDDDNYSVELDVLTYEAHLTFNEIRNILVVHQFSSEDLNINCVNCKKLFQPWVKRI